MIVSGRKVVFKAEFTNSLKEILDWLESNDYDLFAKKFSKEVYDVIMNKIAPAPESHAEYPFKRTPDRLYRRFIFRKKYYIVFKVLPQKLEILTIVYAKRDLSKIPIE